MRRSASLLAAIAAVTLALAPALAEARVGGGRSSGSRGSQTYSPPAATQTAPNQARPVERSMTEPGRNAAAPAQAQRPFGQAAGAATGGFFSRSPFMAGLMGGLIGVGLGGLLFGNGLFGGISGFAGFLGLLLQIALIAGLVWLLVRLVRGSRGGAPRPAMAGAGTGATPPYGMARTGHGPAAAGGGGLGLGGARGAAAASSGLARVQLDKADFDAFERNLAETQAAWTRGDLPALQRLATPEMVQYFADDLAEHASRGVKNEVREVKLEQGDLSEAWRENGRDYATVAMRFSMIDVTRRLSDGAVVEGDPNRRTEAVEIWTFVRAGGGGTWLLSAIQQTG